MPRTVREKRLDSPAARAKLKHSGKPYWRAIDTGLHLGYRKGLNGGQMGLPPLSRQGNYDVETIGNRRRSFAGQRRRAPSISSRRNGARARSRHLPRRRRGGPLPSRPPWTPISLALHMKARIPGRCAAPGAASYPPGARRYPVADLTRDSCPNGLQGWQGKPRTGMTADAIRQPGDSKPGSHHPPRRAKPSL